MLAVCAKWEVNGTAIGEVTDTRRLRVFDGDELVGDLPVVALVDECPTYELEPAEPATPLYPAPPRDLESEDPGEILLGLLGSANLASRKGCSSSTTRSSAPAPSAGPSRPTRPCSCCRTRRRRHGSPRARTAQPAIAMSIDGNGRRVAADPYRGAVEAVLECSANLACVGAEPLGLTNCLNFGNPEKPHIAWQFSRAIAGLGDACRAFGIPVVGGNVSLYNEGGGGPIYPTPVVGLVGELPDARKAGRLGFQNAGDVIAIVAADSGRRPTPLRSSRSCAARPSRGRSRTSSWASSRRCTPRSARRAVGRSVLRARRGRGWRRGRPGRVCPGRWPGRDGVRPRTSCSARARARSSSPARPRP